MSQQTRELRARYLPQRPQAANRLANVMSGLSGQDRSWLANLIFHSHIGEPFHSGRSCSLHFWAESVNCLPASLTTSHLLKALQQISKSEQIEDPSGPTSRPKAETSSRASGAFRSLLRLGEGSAITTHVRANRARASRPRHVAARSSQPSDPKTGNEPSDLPPPEPFQSPSPPAPSRRISAKTSKLSAVGKNSKYESGQLTIA